ncbi:MAG TPA: hypothetical protein VE010_14675 [Thermoanaerobaculia bacterium]|nr:hypothetical protein [Thermoanaerobaculia bacterium]
MGKLTITCRGICTHFVGHVKDVPHRVVLPDATAIRFGQIRITQPNAAAAPANYYTVPHYPFIAPDPVPPGDSKAVVGLSGVRVTVANAVERQPMKHERSFHELICSLADFLPGYSPSEEVVFGRRAACHFDIARGNIRAELRKGVPVVIIEIETVGPPRLRLDPLGYDVTWPPELMPGPEELVLTDENAAITLGNLEVDQQVDVPQFDYLLHYLTDSGGIPKLLAKPTPGMTDSPPSQSDEQIAAALATFAGFVAAQAPTVSRFIAGQSLTFDDLQIALAGVTVACADARFP